MTEKDKQSELNQKAIAHLEEWETDQAMALFEAALRLRRTVEALNNLAYLYIRETNEYDVAKTLLLEAVAQQPHSHYPFSLLGEALIYLGEWDQAHEVLAHSVVLHPSAEAIKRLAHVQLNLDRFEEAAESFRRIATPGDVHHEYLVWSLEQAGHHEEALHEVLTFDTQSEDYIGDERLAILLNELGEYEKAAELFSRNWTLDCGPYDPLVFVEHYAYALYQVREIDKLADLIQESLGYLDKEFNTLEAWEERKAFATHLTNLVEAFETGYTPEYERHYGLWGECYLFGCSCEEH